MLKSTHRPLQHPQSLVEPPLPPGWSSHTAPTGHTYYHHAETNQSTYTRPVFSGPQQDVSSQSYPSTSFVQGQPRAFTREIPPQARNRRYHNSSAPEDRPKSKHEIPGCTPWLLVKTRLGRRFVYNPATGDSFWKVPKDLIGGIVEFDIQERDRRQEKTADKTTESSADVGLDENTRTAKSLDQQEGNKPQKESLDEAKSSQSRDMHGVANQLDDEYEEVEVEITDDEEEDEQANSNPPNKRRRTSPPPATATALSDDPQDQRDADADIDIEAEAEARAELDNSEAAMAAQLAHLGQSYALDPGEYGAPDDDSSWEEGASGLPLTQSEINDSFASLLDDFNINPYSTWDSIISSNTALVEDDRYVVLPNTKSRLAFFTRWSAAKIKEMAEQRAQEAKQKAKENPLLPYLAFLQLHATPKLYWPEFKRKFKKTAELKDVRLADKERERLYREYINRTTKTSAEKMEADLQDLLKGFPREKLGQGVRTDLGSGSGTDMDEGVEGLPDELVVDMRFVVVPARKRNELVQRYLGNPSRSR